MNLTNRAAPQAEQPNLEKVYIYLSLRYDLVVCVRSELVDERIDQTEEKNAEAGTCEQERDVVVTEQ